MLEYIVEHYIVYYFKNLAEYYYPLTKTPKHTQTHIPCYEALDVNTTF